MMAAQLDLYDEQTVEYLQALVGSDVAPGQALVDRVHRLAREAAVLRAEAAAWKQAALAASKAGA